MIKSSKHRIDNITNKDKLSELNSLFDVFGGGVSFYIDLILSGELPLTKKLSSKLCPNIDGVEMASYKTLIYKQASEIVRSNIDKANSKRFARYKKIYSYFKKNNRQTKFTSLRFNELKLNEVHKTKYFTRPNLKNVSIRLDDIKRFFNFQESTHFDEFVSIKLPKLKDDSKHRFVNINVPIKHHRHSNKLIDSSYTRKNCIVLERRHDGMITVSLIWENNEPPKKLMGDVVGVDMGYKKLMVTSDGEIIGDEFVDIYEKISRKVQGSKAFKRALEHRDNEINRLCNTLTLGYVKTLVIEDLKNVKKGKRGKFVNKLQRWSYPKTVFKLENMCSVHGVELVKVLPQYTSQMCSSCGEVNKESRNKEVYNCISCGYVIDADLNASINIRDKYVSAI